MCNKVKEVFPVHGNIHILGKDMDRLICAMVVTEIMELILISLVVKVMVSCFSKNNCGKKNKVLCLRHVLKSKVTDA